MPMKKKRGRPRKTAEETTKKPRTEKKSTKSYEPDEADAVVASASNSTSARAIRTSARIAKLTARADIVSSSQAENDNTQIVESTVHVKRGSGCSRKEATQAIIPDK